MGTNQHFLPVSLPRNAGVPGHTLIRSDDVKPGTFGRLSGLMCTNPQERAMAHPSETGLELFSPSFDGPVNGADFATSTLQSDIAQSLIDDLEFTFAGV